MKRIVIIITVLMSLKGIAQQDPQYSLYQFNQMVINPGYAGARDAIAIVADMRKQWMGFDGAPTTAALSVHSPVLNNQPGVGINLVNDRLGQQAVTGLYGNVAYLMKIGNTTKLSFGLRGGYAMYKFNFDEVKYKDADENAYTDLNNANKGSLDVDAGLYLRTNSFFVGLSATHLNKGVLYKKDVQALTTGGLPADYSVSYVLSPHVFLTIGKSWAINENFLISPSLMVKTVQRKTTADLNFNFLIKKRVWAGVFFRQGYGAGALFQVYATKQLRIGYAFDAGLGKQRLLRGSHEIMIGFDIKKDKSKMVSPRLL